MEKTASTAGETAEPASPRAAASASASGDRVADGDEDFRTFVTQRWAVLVRLAYGLTGDRGLAEDLVQTTLAKAYTSWPKVCRAEDPDAYVRRILVNSNHGRFRKRRVDEHPAAAPPECAIGDLTADVDRRAALRPALMQLPARQRAVIVLRFWADLTESQTADALGCSVGTVKSQTARALSRLRASSVLREFTGTDEGGTR